MTSTALPSVHHRPDAPTVHSVIRNVHPDSTFWMEGTPESIHFGWDCALYATGETVAEKQRNLRDALLKGAELLTTALDEGQR